ncbi:hypothetical protein N8I77_008356 [Diaporthe amygdali]|uniref:Uncharacterized protein n=1 Tax=Phomopsis amygdali TaxID=1214568 RepID=A0AAD9SEU0_PHOAM|nr:hypothetical protein N8I77_008356 [Diaporthe amygdali]
MKTYFTLNKHHMSKSNTSFPLLKQLAMQKWKPERVYEKVGVRDEESSNEYPRADEVERVSRGTRTRPLISGIVVTGLMAVCIAGIVWWPGRIQDQAIRMAAYDHSHQDHPSHPAHDHSDSHLFEHLGPSSSSDHSPYPQSKDDDTVATCGSTLAEAQALNCTWDLLAAAWLPPACIDEELTADFRAQGPWTYFADREGTQELFEEELQYRVGKGNEYYTSLRYHKTHCSYQWRKMHRAMERGTKIENKLADYHHTMHCGYVQMQQGDMEDLMTKITVELMTC